MYMLSYWQGAPDNSQEVTKSRRISRVSDIPNTLRPIPKECDYIALERTDKQSPMFKIVWSRPRK